MAEPEVIVDPDQDNDEEMQTADITAEENGEPSGLEDIEPTVAERTGFIE